MSNSTEPGLQETAATYIQQQIQAQHMTVSALSNLTNVPSATINNIIYGRSRNPSFETMVTLICALGGSIDALINKPVEPSVNMHDMQEICGQAERGWRQMVVFLSGLYQRERRGKKLATLFLAITYLLAAIFIIRDILNGRIGYVRYPGNFAELLKMILQK